MLPSVEGVVVVLLVPVRRLHLRSDAVPTITVIAAAASAGLPPPPPPDRRLHRRCEIVFDVTVIAASASTCPPLPQPLRPLCFSLLLRLLPCLLRGASSGFNMVYVI